MLDEEHDSEEEGEIASVGRISTYLRSGRSGSMKLKKHLGSFNP